MMHVSCVMPVSCIILINMITSLPLICFHGQSGHVFPYLVLPYICRQLDLHVYLCVAVGNVCLVGKIVLLTMIAWWHHNWCIMTHNNSLKSLYNHYVWLVFEDIVLVVGSIALLMAGIIQKL